MFKNMKIGIKLGLGFGLILLLISALGLFSIVQMRLISEKVDRIANDLFPKTIYCNNLIDQVNEAARAVSNMIILTDVSQIKVEEKHLDEIADSIKDEFQKLEEKIKTAEDKKLLSEVMNARQEYIPLQNEIRKLVNENKKDAAIVLLLGKFRDNQIIYMDKINKLSEYQTDMTKQYGKEGVGAANTSQTAIIIVALVILLIGIAAAILITKTITTPIARCIDIAGKVAAGNTDISIDVDSKDETGQLLAALDKMIQSIKSLVIDVGMLSKEAVEGKLTTRADASKHQGDFRKIVQGVDDCLDSVIGPLNLAAKYVDEISKGNIPPKINDNYNGDFNTIKNNLNQCIDAVNLLVTDVNMLAQAGIDGRLAIRADATKHNGDFRKIVEGVNGTLDAVITPINEAQSALERVASRDLTARVSGEYNGDMAKIKIAINTAVDNLDKALQQVTEATEQVSTASGQISSGSQSLAEGANEQASSLEEVSSSLEEMSSMTKQNADNANQAKGLASESDTNAKSGTEAMDRMSNAINRIKESSDQTAKIVKTIDEIAMQTNLLALNAAVEAARAGEAGRGFAVVAEEVRNLAQRSAQAAKNTADMITESVKNADDGVKIAVEVSQSFETIATSAKKVNDLIAEIAAASQEQSSGIEQINTAVSQMDKVTQQNAANSEESASAAEELSSQAEELKNMISQFALSHSSMSVSTSKKMASTHTIAHAQVKEKNSFKTIGKKSSGKTTYIKPEDIIPLDDDALKEF
ncbi:MAG TPA: methyl-accepting chemotaxis protein [Chitinispirillaceae bacterium]|nr:methyl-accepting chemotaxis protein [Chitinispirillaceae bacterium]